MSNERIESLRTHQFTLARRGGYDKDEVDQFLARFADWLESSEARTALAQVEIERVGERTGAILSAAQQSADDTAAEARAAADATRAKADSYAAEQRSSADQQANQTIREADQRLERAEREAEERTAAVDAELAGLAKKREVIIANLRRLDKGIREMVDGPGSEEFDLPKRSRTAAAFAAEPEVADEPGVEPEVDRAVEPQTRVQPVSEVAEEPAEPDGDDLIPDEDEDENEGAVAAQPTQRYTPDFDTDDDLLDPARPPDPIPSSRDSERSRRRPPDDDPSTDEQRMTELL